MYLQSVLSMSKIDTKKYSQSNVWKISAFYN